MAARAWLSERIVEAGGRTWMDGAGNVVGRWFEQEAPAVVVGSHIDSVRGGGLFDGTVGVLAGLEIARVLSARSHAPARPFELVAFCDEEGRFGGMFGVQAYCGMVSAEWLSSAKDPQGVRLVDAMRAQGMEPARALEAGRSKEDVHAFFELHIEQGPVLEAKRRTIGVVEGISGIFKWSVRLEGEANHAGTTPMHLRKDAFRGLTDFAHAIPTILGEVGSSESRLTIGQVHVSPNHPHIVPGEVTCTLIGRDMDRGVLQSLAKASQESLSAAAETHGLRWSHEELSWLEPELCHPGIVDMLAQASRQHGFDPLFLPSGAGHDTQFMAKFVRSGMIFIPSVGGLSHAPEEQTHWSDIEAGTRVLLTAIEQLV